MTASTGTAGKNNANALSFARETRLSSQLVATEHARQRPADFLGKDELVRPESMLAKLGHVLTTQLIASICSLGLSAIETGFVAQIWACIRPVE
ncbi:hypothetical protein [Paludibacterium denitrificans]|uniref:Uncharacterized protein n=1 Tax=Paludibacterium denitrificans TaxID=2675226 RepID=A0A844GG36_9NEIS|nr:hypothetical protein [Paludibacterium denitrificans]MTD34176.1 hypothetical protein [Paludibacterium denitrificans]MTD34241.1 hypothetical protein [Paludibacterium denitrificans]